MVNKLYILACILTASVFSAYATEEYGWVYLNNGNELHGTITRNETHVIVLTDDGHTYEYPLIQVRKISGKQEYLPEVSSDPDLRDYTKDTTGFWIAGEITAAYSCFLSHGNRPMIEGDIVGGWRFNEYLRAGLGIGFRGYPGNDHIRYHHFAGSFPIFANARGNVYKTGYHTVVPFWSASIGGAIRDGFMMRPAFGIRVGQDRAAFTAALSYTGQSLKYKNGKTKFCSFLGITLGYEY